MESEDIKWINRSPQHMSLSLSKLPHTPLAKSQWRKCFQNCVVTHKNKQWWRMTALQTLDKHWLMCVFVWEMRRQIWRPLICYQAGLCLSFLLAVRQEVAVINTRAVVLCFMSDAAAGSGLLQLVSEGWLGFLALANDVAVSLTCNKRWVPL